MARVKATKSYRTGISSYSKKKKSQILSIKLTAKRNGQKYFQLEKHVSKKKNTLQTVVGILFINF